MHQLHASCGWNLDDLARKKHETTPFNSVVLFLLVNFGWWVTILGMVGDHDHPGDGG